MRTAIIIPARLAATRLPGKPLAMLGGVPLVVRVAQQAQRCPGVDTVVIATDSHDIASTVAWYHIETVMTRADHVSGTDRVAEAAVRIGAELVVNCQGDEPFIDPADLATVVTALQRGGSDLVTLKAPLIDEAELTSSSVVKVVCRDDDSALYFSRAPIPFDAAGHAAGAMKPDANTFRHVGVYGYHLLALTRMSQTPPHPLELREKLEQLRALAMGLRILVLPAKSVARGIDTEEDLAWARERVQRLGQAAFP